MTKKRYLFDKSVFAFVFYVLFVSIGICLSQKSYAQKTDSTKVNQLKQVEINERKLSRQQLSPTPLQILNSEDLKRINSLSVADAMRYFSGIQLKDYGGIGGIKTINVRSMGSNHTAVFYNGIQLSNAQNGQVDLGQYSLNNLEEISLYNGQKSDVLQPAKAYASASAIFLKTKTPTFENGKKQSLAAYFKTGDFGLVNPSLLYQLKLDTNTSASVSTEWIKANGKYKFNYTNGVYDTTAIRNNGDVDRLRLEANVFGKLKKAGTWQLQWYGFLSERGLPGAIVSNKFDYTQRIWNKETFLQGNLTQQFGKLSLLFNGKLGYQNTRYLDPEFITLNGFLDNRLHEKEAYLSAAANYQLTKYLSFGASSDYQFQDLNANIYRFAYPNRNTFLNVFHVMFQTERIQIQGNLLSTTVNDGVEVYESAGNKQVFSPTLMFSFQPIAESNLRLRGFYKDIFRMPTFNDLYYTFVGNTFLNPEYSKQYDFGFTYSKAIGVQKLSYFELQGDAFYHTITDKIVAQPGANLYRWIMYNIGKVETKGLEFNAKSGFTLDKSWAVGFSVNYTYQDAIDLTDRTEESYGNQIPYIPNHSGSFLTKLDYKNWKLNYSFIYTGARYNQKANIIYNYMQPWYTHDAALGYAWKKLTVNVEVNNFLNQYYDVIPNFPMPGRNYRIGLSWTY